MSRKIDVEPSFKASLRIPYRILDRIDELAKVHNRDRTGEINNALQEYIERNKVNIDIDNLLDELEDDPKFTELNNRYLALKEKFNKELDKAFLEVMKGD
ncbi:ribbon-helix-helix domain-containing protein [Methanoplanus limicola]|jgi:catalase (peroxidase I)|uniref:Uncharacterized protein n=1 Tax=Methanoplanus limicola DSM 2279 TaxID=937775 RepID=H1Z2N8_9EURY|nr:hypothetical protein [Methanoplanus limicola]EHQ36441.1 hypothetical protein Metlim_2390 [Methanoplanus limicola DSM 2279]